MAPILAKSLLALALAATLAACTSLMPAPAAKPRALDYRIDDLASLIVALDVPSPLQPVPELSALRFDVTSPGQGERHVAAILTLTDPGELAGTLPPPGKSRAYYLLGFSDADKAVLREAQSWARTLPAASPQISVTPRFCTTAQVDLAGLTYSVLLALPSTPTLAPLTIAQPIAATLTNGELPIC